MTVCCPLNYSDDNDYWSFFSSSKICARKEHNCGECGDVIEAGQKYENAKGLYDGNFSTMKTCIPCVEVRDHFACEGFIFGQIWEDIQNNMFPGMVAGGECLRGASVVAKQKLFHEYTEWLLDGGWSDRAFYNREEEIAMKIQNMKEQK